MRKSGENEVKNVTGKLRQVGLNGQDKDLCFCSKWDGKSLGRCDEKEWHDTNYFLIESLWLLC